jgi:DNA-binding transcriptional MerR regulator
MRKERLSRSDAARIVECHPNSILNYEKRGLIYSVRDFNGFRWYSLDAVLSLKDKLAVRS